MALIETRELTAGYGGEPLLVDINLRIEAGERICLVGRNGVGKSTLLKVLAGEIKPTTGLCQLEAAAKVTMLAQQVPADIGGSVFHVVAEGLGEVGKWLDQYHELAAELEHNDTPQLHKRFDNLASKIQTVDGWRLEQQVETILTRIGIEDNDTFANLSAGMKRRVLLGRALVAKPDVLLLDEPTNHLDIASIDWMEQFILDSKQTLVFVTHDRSFLRRIATRIIEIDRGQARSYECDFDTYKQRREAELEAESKQNDKFDRKLSEEEAWIRRGIKARGRRNMGRVRELIELRTQRRDRKDRIGSAKMELTDAANSGRQVILAKGISFAYDQGDPIFANLSTMIMRGDRIGIIGPNGCGKTTLINVLLGKLQPTSGEIKHGVNLEIAYFDQLHAQLDDEKTVVENIAGGPREIDINGRKRHIFGYMQDFLFTPERAKQPVGRLSGGERNRLLLAKLFMQPSNVLVLDEPTNDLDAETLDLLEECLATYAGTVLTVSHDRTFLNNIVTSTLAFDPDKTVREYVGGYDDYSRQSASIHTQVQAEIAPKPKPQINKPAKPKPRRLSYKEKQELETLPARLERLEIQKADLENQLSDPDFYKKPGDQIAVVTENLKAATEELEEVYERWGFLESLEE